MASTAAKRIRVSDDNGANWYTLPGNSGEMTDEMGQIVDTIFGQNFESNQPGIIGWNIQANALYKGFAGYVATLKQVGASATVANGEAFTLLTGKRYQINAASKQIWDRSDVPVVYDNAIAVSAADILSYDYLNGIIEFVSTYTVTGPVTADVSYFTTSVIAKGKSFTLTETADAIDNTDFETAQGNSGHRTHEEGLQRVSLEIGGIYDSGNAFRTALLTRAEIIIEIAPSGALTGSYCRGYFKRTGRSQSGDVGALEEETMNFNLSVPDDDKLELPFKWVHPGTSTLNPSVQKVLNAWQTRSAIDVRYLPNGTQGWAGDAIVTEVTLSGGLEVMNEFQCQFQGSGAAAAVV